MGNKQRSETADLVREFYLLIYKEFNKLIKNYLQSNNNEDLEGDDFISSFDKYFKNFVENGKFFVEVTKRVKDEGSEKKKKKIKVEVPYLELHTENEEIFVFVNINIRKVKDNFNRAPFETCKKLAEEMGYDYKRYVSKNKKNDKAISKSGFRIPYSDFEKEINICALKELNRKANKLDKEKEVLEKDKEVLEKEIFLKKIEIKKLKYDKQENEENIRGLEGKIKDSKVKNDSLIKEISKFKSDNLSIKIELDDANKKLAERNKVIHALLLKNKKDASHFNDFKENYWDVLYNVWRLGRPIEKDYKFNKQCFESLNNLVNFFGKNLDNSDNGFGDKGVDLEFIENQKLFINESLRSLEKSYKQYKRVLILLEKNGIRIENYDDVKDEDKLNVTILDVIESSEVNEIMVETIKPSIYYAEKKNSKDKGTEKRIFEGEIILTKPKEK